MENIPMSNPPEKKNLSHPFKEEFNNQALHIETLQHQQIHIIQHEALEEEPMQGMEVVEEDVAQDEEQIYSLVPQLIKIKDLRA